MWLLAAILLTGFIYLAYHRFNYALALFVFLLPSYLWRLTFLTLPTTFLEMMLLALLAIWLIKDKRYRQINWRLYHSANNHLNVTVRYLLLFWLLASLLALNINPTDSALGLWRAYFLEPIMFCLLLVYNIKDKRDLQLIIRALAGLALTLTIVTIYQNWTNWNLAPAYNYPNVRRLTAVFSYPNALALLVAPLSAFFAALALKLPSKERYLRAAVAISGLSLVLLAFSQGAILALAISALVYVLSHRRYRLPAIITIAALSLASLFYFDWGTIYRNYQQQFFNPQLDLAASSLEIRSSQWQETWALLQDRGLYGVGIGGYQRALLPYHEMEWLEIYLYPHNLFLNFWVELGLLGLLVFMALAIYLGHCLYSLFKNKHKLAWPLTLFWLTWLIHGLVDVPYFKNDLSLLFFLFFALTIIISNQKNKNIFDLQ